MNRYIIRLAIITALFVLPFKAYSQYAIEVCADGPVTLMAGNFQHGTIQWERSVDNINWDAIPNAYDITYEFTPEASMYYRAVNKQYNCPPAYSQVTFVQIPPVASAGVDRVVPGNEITLFANMEARASGVWSVYSGNDGGLSDITDNHAVFQGSESEYTLVWTLTNTCGISHDTLNIAFRQNTYVEELVVVDETDDIQSTPQQLEEGLYIIAFSEPVPTIAEGTYLVGIPDGGFLRRVESFTLSNNTYSMQTSQATLEDITDEGAFDFGHLFSIDETINSTLDKLGDYYILDYIPTRNDLLNDPKFRTGKYVYIGQEELIPHKSGIVFEKQKNENNQPLFNFAFPNVKIADEEDGQFEIVLNGGYSFTPNLVLDLDYSWFTLHHFKMGLDNAVEELDIGLHITSQLADYSLIDKKFSLFSVSHNFIFVIGPVPVVVQVKIDLKGEVSANVGAVMSFDYGYNRKNYFTANIEYSDNDWKRNFSNPPPVVNKQFDFSLTGGASQSFKIGPEVSFRLYQIVGPYIGLMLKQDAQICATQDFDWNASLELGGELTLGAKAEILKTTLFDTYYSWEQGIYSYRFPYALEIVSGNNQTYVPGQTLAHGAKIKVRSNKGVQLPLARVVFEPLSGGSVSKGVVMADRHGFAETSWTPADAQNSQLRVSVLDCQGRHIMNSPLTFNAYTTATDCNLSTLSVGINKTNNTIQPQAYLGVPPYEYSTDGVSYHSTVPVITVSQGNLYTFYVRDANQCIASTSYNDGAEVTPTLTLSVMASKNTVEAQAQGGKPPYEYSLNSSTSGFSANNIFTGVPNGQHMVYARDANHTLVSKGVTVNYQSDGGSGTFTDTRDGQTYKWVKIGDQVWMAENLRYLPSVVGPGTGSTTTPYYYVHGYNGTDVNDAKATENYQNYGVLYNLPAAMNEASSSSSNPSGVQGVCPPGWHLPSDAEWTQLVDYIVSQGYLNDMYNPSGEGNALKSCHQVNSPLGGECNTSDHPRWDPHSTHYGIDEFAFTAYPGGYRYALGRFYYLGTRGYWWSTTKGSTTDGWYRMLHSEYGHVSRFGSSGAHGLSVRCVRD